MTPTMSTWCSNQLSYDPKVSTARSTKEIIARYKSKSKHFFQKIWLILERGYATIHPITHLSPVMACAASAVADHEKGEGGE